MKKIFYLLSIAILFFSCSEEAETSKSQKDIKPTIEPVHISSVIDGCEGKLEECTHIDIKTFKVTETEGRNIAETNRVLTDEAVKLASESISEGDELTYEEIEETFFNDWKTFVEQGGADFPWYININTETEQIEKFINVKMSLESYTGGAHSNTYTKFFLIDVNNGHKKDISNYITRGSDFMAMAEDHFREVNDISIETPLEETGFFFEDGKFELPQEMGLARNGIILYYNTYEIQAYSEGPMEIVIPFEKLGNLLDLDL